MSIGIRPLARWKAALLQLVCTGALLAGCGGGGGGGGGGADATSTVPTQPASKGDTPVAWNNAEVYEPFTTKSIPIAGIASDATPAPVALVFHGCLGPNFTSNQWALFLAAEGYRVVLPNSLARPDRAGRYSCDANTKGVTANVDIYDMRIDEVRYAVEAAQLQRWWDRKGLMVLGHSEGGLAVTQSTSAVVSQVVVVGYWCLRDVLIPTNVPVATLNSSQDPWFTGFNVTHDCGRRLASRTGTDLYLGSGDSHDMLFEPATGIVRTAARRVATTSGLTVTSRTYAGTVSLLGPFGSTTGPCPAQQSVAGPMRVTVTSVNGVPRGATGTLTETDSVINPCTGTTSQPTFDRTLAFTVSGGQLVMDESTPFTLNDGTTGSSRYAFQLTPSADALTGTGTFTSTSPSFVVSATGAIALPVVP